MTRNIARFMPNYYVTDTLSIIFHKGSVSAPVIYQNLLILASSAWCLSSSACRSLRGLPSSEVWTDPSAVGIGTAPGMSLHWHLQCPGKVCPWNTLIIDVVSQTPFAGDRGPINREPREQV